jgi:hypothetical protein
MTRAQILILAVLSMLVCIVFGIAAVVIRAQLASFSEPAIAAQPSPEPNFTEGPTATQTIVPTNTFTPTPIDTLTPTPTATRVVLDTPTPTPSGTPTITPIPTPTNTLVVGGSSASRRFSSGPRPTPVPTSRYPLKLADGPVAYETKNYILVVYARITSGGALLPGYRMVGTHTPSGVHIESAPSCNYLCKASGPKEEDTLIQEANLAFEAYFYDTGTWSMVILDPQGHQASEVFDIQIDINDRKWFYYHFNR